MPKTTKRAAEKPKPPRKTNPGCGGCGHAVSFHPRDAVSHRRPCKALGCGCRNYKKKAIPAEEPTA